MSNSEFSLNQDLDAGKVDRNVTLLTGDRTGKASLIETLEHTGRYVVIRHSDPGQATHNFSGICIQDVSDWTPDSLRSLILSARSAGQHLVLGIPFRTVISSYRDVLPPVAIEAVVDERGQVDVLLALKI